MGWPLGGNWDRATAPPGASGADLPAICEAICKAINDRALYRSYDSSGTANGTQYSIHYDATHTATYPTAAQFGASMVNPLNNGFVQTFWADCKTAIDAIASSFRTDNTFATAWSASSLWSAAGAGLGAWDTTKNWGYVDNWLRIKAALSLLRYYRVTLSPTSSPREIWTTTYTFSDPGTNPLADIMASKVSTTAGFGIVYYASGGYNTGLAAYQWQWRTKDMSRFSIPNLKGSLAPATYYFTNDGGGGNVVSPTFGAAAFNPSTTYKVGGSSGSSFSQSVFTLGGTIDIGKEITYSPSGSFILHDDYGAGVAAYPIVNTGWNLNPGSSSSGPPWSQTLLLWVDMASGLADMT